MRNLKRLAIFLSLIAVFVVAADARTRKGEGLLKKGREAESRKQWEVALDFYEQAMLDDPDDAAYQLAARRVRFQASMARVDSGQKLRAAGQLEEALADFQKAYAIDPSSSIAEQEIRRTRQMIEREKAPETKSATPEDRGRTPAEKAQMEAEAKADRILAVPELKPITREIATLRMNNQPVKVLYETVGKLAGINVIFDPEYQNPPGKGTFSIDLTNTTLDQALDYLAIQTKSFWKPLSPNTIFVTNDNVTKRRDYEDYVVKVFYIKNATTVQELQEISTTVRSVTEIRRAFTYNAQWAILLRGTADQIALAEKLIQDLDKPKAEVVVDVIVMEANRARVRDLASTFLTNGSQGIDLPISYTGPAENGVIPLKELDQLGIGDYSIKAPSGILKAIMTDSSTRILQQPQVRAVENFKGSLKIGDRIPYATGSFQPGIGTVGGLNPLVSTQFNFLDTGVNVDITPKVHGRNEVSLHVEVDVSSKSGEVDLGGLRQPQVSRRTIVHDVRMREGEVNVLGGLLGTQETISKAGVPFLMDIPVLGRLFSTEKVDRARGELLIVLIPHVVRAPDYSETNLRGVSAGNDQNVKLNFAPPPVKETPAAPAAQPAGAVAAPAVAPGAPAAQPPAGATAPPAAVPAAPSATPTAPAAPAEAPAKPAADAPAAAATAGPRLTFAPAAVQTQLSAPFTVAVQIENVSDLFTAPMRVKFDPKVLRLNSVQPGALMASDGQKLNFTQNTMNDTGEAVITLNRIPGTGGVSGSGQLVILTFQAIAKGPTSVAVVDAGLRNMQLQPLTVAAPVLNVVVQ